MIGKLSKRELVSRVSGPTLIAKDARYLLNVPGMVAYPLPSSVSAATRKPLPRNAQLIRTLLGLDHTIV